MHTGASLTTGMSVRIVPAGATTGASTTMMTHRRDAGANVNVTMVHPDHAVSHGRGRSRVNDRRVVMCCLHARIPGRVWSAVIEIEQGVGDMPAELKLERHPRLFDEPQSRINAVADSRRMVTLRRSESCRVDLHQVPARAREPGLSDDTTSASIPASSRATRPH